MLLETRSLTKRFPGDVALKAVSFGLAAGEIHALCGENGAGKSTLIKLLSGIHPHGSYEGELCVDGRTAHFKSIRDSESHGIAVITQEFALVVGEPTTFRFFASSVRREDRVGDLIDDASRSEDLEEVAPIETTLSGEAGKLVPVNLQAAVTEVGTLEVRCLQKDGPGRRKLEMNVRTAND